MLRRLALLCAALVGVDAKGWGVWKDPKHYVGHHSYAGMRFVSESPPHVLTMVGLDDPSPDFESWWTIKGYCEDGPNGPMTEITFDFSSRGGPEKFTGKFTDNGDGTSSLVWPDGSAWEWALDPLKPDPEHM